MDLFGPDLLDATTHKAVFGELPSSLVHELRTPEVGDLVLQLLDIGWRRGQLASRIAALPTAADPLAAITELLRGFLGQIPPDARWREDKARRERERDAERSSEVVERPASEESRQQWLSRIRAELSGPHDQRRPRPTLVRPACALCGEESAFFVTREVRLCPTCVALLSDGGVRLTVDDVRSHDAHDGHEGMRTAG